MKIIHELYTGLKKSKILPLLTFPPSTYVVFTRHNVPWLANFTSALRFRANYATFIIRNTSSCNGMRPATHTCTLHTCRARGGLFIAAKGSRWFLHPGLRREISLSTQRSPVIPLPSTHTCNTRENGSVDRAWIKCNRNYRDRNGQFIWERYFAARREYRAK